MKYNRKIIALAVIGAMVSSLAFPVNAKENTSEKEEVIYVNLEAEGSVKDIYAVNIFGSGNIVDYGDYKSVEMLNSNDEISQKGDEISFSTETERVYYKGEMNTKEMPWNIELTYYLNGKEIPASELAGKSGSLEMKFEITENDKATGNFFEGYALQASFALDTEKCKDIVAEGATIANVGSDKQLTYTILPGRGIDARWCSK